MSHNQGGQHHELVGSYKAHNLNIAKMFYEAPRLNARHHKFSAFAISLPMKLTACIY